MLNFTYGQTLRVLTFIKALQLLIVPIRQFPYPLSARRRL